MSRRRRRMSAEEEELDEWMCRAMNPDGLIRVVLPSGASATVSPGISHETLMALDRLAVAAMAPFLRDNDGQKEEQ